MSIQVILAPVFTRPYTTTAAHKARPAAGVRKSASWEDLASDQRWAEAIIAYLQQNWRGQHRVWAVINAIVAEALPECRWQTREYAKEALDALMGLVRDKRVLRYRRKWIASLHSPPVIPLELVPLDRLRRI